MLSTLSYRQSLSTLLLVICTLLSACAGPQAAAPPTMSQKTAAIAPWASKGRLLLVEVPASSNAISNQMIVASLKVGTSSNAADQIVQMLRSGSAATVAVTGSNLEINAATVQAALRAWAAAQAKTNTTILMVGRPADTTELEKAAASASVKLEFADLP